MIRGWTNSNSTSRRRRRAYEAIAESKGEVETSGRHARADTVAPESFYTRPHDVPPLVSYDGGVAEALRTHLAEQGLSGLASNVEQLEALGRRVNKLEPASDSVSELVYEMH